MFRRQIDQDCDDNASCAPPPYKIEGELYEWICQAVPPERIGEVAGLAKGGDFDVVRRTMGSGLLAGRRTGACPHMEGEWLALRRFP